MKKILLSLFVLPLCFVSFSFASLFPDLENSIQWTDSNYFSTCNKYACQWSNPWFKTFRCSWNWTMTISYNTSSSNGLSKDISCPWNFDIDWVDWINFIYRENSQSDFVIYVSSSATPSWYFSPVVSWLLTSINEFIPYVVYVSLGILWVLIWFVAIRWLILWIRSKVFNSFNK